MSRRWLLVLARFCRVDGAATAAAFQAQPPPALCREQSLPNRGNHHTGKHPPSAWKGRGAFGCEKSWWQQGRRQRQRQHALRRRSGRLEADALPHRSAGCLPSRATQASFLLRCNIALAGAGAKTDSFDYLRKSCGVQSRILRGMRAWWVTCDGGGIRLRVPLTTSFLEALEALHKEQTRAGRLLSE